ncbi:hypothetical protein BDB01DRAFT_385705 [Pilobolus umbonatus]|nr:hypothetical protein BDB01DRAFT_385705 [Pilobolus umbonatus]
MSKTYTFSHTNIKAKAPKLCTGTEEAKVPRPLNCFMLFRLDKQKEIVKVCPGANHRDISKIISKWWKEITPEVREFYQLKAMVAKREHHKKYPNYKFNPRRKTNPTRRYRNRPGDQFTSKEERNNQMLATIYHNDPSGKQESNDYQHEHTLYHGVSFMKPEPIEYKHEPTFTEMLYASEEQPDIYIQDYSSASSSVYNPIMDVNYLTAANSVYSFNSSSPTQSTVSMNESSPLDDWKNDTYDNRKYIESSILDICQCYPDNPYYYQEQSRNIRSYPTHFQEKSSIQLLSPLPFSLE